MLDGKERKWSTCAGKQESASAGIQGIEDEEEASPLGRIHVVGDEALDRVLEVGT